MRQLPLSLISATLLFAGTVHGTETNEIADESDWDNAWAEFDEETNANSPWSWEASVELATGIKIYDDPTLSSDTTLAEIRNNWSIFYEQDRLKATLKLDLIADNIESEHSHQVREANAYYRAFEYLDFKVGRQILTWGTGDLIFLNDMFPKDWQSFFSGRETQYLKAPSDALKTSIYTAFLNLDIVYSPKFDPDTYINGNRLSYYSSATEDYEAAPPTLDPNLPEKLYRDNETSYRLSTKDDGSEYALYYYTGFYKSPVGATANPSTGLITPSFPRLKTYGASFRTSNSLGIINAEIARYQSKDDPTGSNPLIPNDQDRILIGFETEAATDLTLGFQYYLEKTKNYEALKSNSLSAKLETREYRHLWTNRITYQTPNRLWTYSLFSFYSPSDKDGYLRPAVSYRHSDRLHLAGGGNIIFGEDKHTFFNRFENNSNFYLRVKYYL